jgi:hypothetical protein
MVPLPPWLREHGLDLPLFFHELHANCVSEFFGADVMISAVIVIAFPTSERRRIGARWWMPIVGLLVFGVSARLPLLLYLREPTRQQSA